LRVARWDPLGPVSIQTILPVRFNGEHLVAAGLRLVMTRD
jgi:hypothetical protein